MREIERLYKRPDLMSEFLREFILLHQVEECLGGRCADGCKRIIADGTGLCILRSFTQALETPWEMGNYFLLAPICVHCASNFMITNLTNFFSFQMNLTLYIPVQQPTIVISFILSIII